MPSPERKAAERISERIFPLSSCDKQRRVELITAIIAEEFAPMRALMERMEKILMRYLPQHDDVALKVLYDYAEMKAGWEADGDAH